MKKRIEGKTVLVTGVTGQDGGFLAKSLIEDGFNVFGTLRRGGNPKTDRLKSLGILDKITFVPLEISDFSNVIQILSDVRPDYIYNLSAQSFVVDSFKHPIITTQTNYIGVLNMLEAIKLLKLDVKFFQPSTSEMYGNSSPKTLTEKNSFSPSNPYGLSKYSAHAALKIYRETYSIDAVTAILFNHESEYRSAEFVTRKITFQLAQLRNGSERPVQLGNLSAARDWGYAEDYIEAMRLIAESKTEDEFVVATNSLNTVKDFFTRAAYYMGYDPEFEGEGVNEKCIDKKTGTVLCEVKKEFFRHSDTKALRGDYSKINNQLGWKPSTKFDVWIEKMVKHDLELTRK